MFSGKEKAIFDVRTIITTEELYKFIDYLHDIYDNRTGSYFFRGLSNSGYQLLPGAFELGPLDWKFF